MTAQHAFTKVALDRFEGIDPRPGVAKNDPILVADGVTRRFGGLTAVSVDHCEIERHAITALIGPNGAGKTTFFNLLTGFDRPDSGTWSFDGDRLDGLTSYRIARRGMVRTFQLTKALARLTVLDNMMLGATQQTGESFLRSLWRPGWRQQEAAITERAEALLDRFSLAHMRGEFAGELSGGQRKLLEMARALMSEPQLLMLDEPMAGVNPALAQTIISHVQQLRDEGLTVVFVEHDMDVVRTISDWVVVMSEGEIIAEGRHGSIVTNENVINAYLGAHHGTPLDQAEQERQLAEAEAELARTSGDADDTAGDKADEKAGETTGETTGAGGGRTADHSADDTAEATGGDQSDSDQTVDEEARS
jgi:branched-chain amino acid transport system ATP-binding protein